MVVSRGKSLRWSCRILPDEQDTLSPVADTHVARLWKVLFFVL
jgi:hypothetical protein